MLSRRSIRWAAPAAAVLAIGAGIGVNNALSAGAAPSLPSRTAAQLLVDLQKADVPGMSGTVVQKADLGLPSLPTTAGSDNSALTGLISGSHTLRVWAGDEGQARVAVLGTLGESDVIRNGRDVWTWSSTKNEASHLTLPAGDAKKPSTAPQAGTVTPQQAANQILKAIDPSTKVTVDGTRSVAGRATYTLRVEPRNASSLIDSVSLSIDSVKHVPLAVRVDAKGQTKPAIDVSFTHVSFAKPAAKEFTFNPPPGAKVTTPKFGGLSDHPARSSDTGKPTTSVVGSDWTQVLVADGVSLRGVGHGRDNELGAMLRNLPRVSGSWGSGRLLSTSLVNALITDDGRIVAGMVTPERLYQVAGK